MTKPHLLSLAYCFNEGCLFLVVILWPQLEKSWTHVIEGFGTHSSSSKGSYRLDVMGEETDESGRWPDLVDITQLCCEAKVEMWACCFIPVSLWIQSRANFCTSYWSFKVFLFFPFSLSLFFYFIENFAIIGAIPDLIRRIPLGIRG